MASSDHYQRVHLVFRSAILQSWSMVIKQFFRNSFPRCIGKPRSHRDSIGHLTAAAYIQARYVAMRQARTYRFQRVGQHNVVSVIGPCDVRYS